MSFNHNCGKHFDKHWVSEALLGNGPKLPVGQPSDSYKKPS